MVGTPLAVAARRRPAQGRSKEAPTGIRADCWTLSCSPLLPRRLAPSVSGGPREDRTRELDSGPIAAGNRACPLPVPRELDKMDSSAKVEGEAVITDWPSSDRHPRPIQGGLDAEGAPITSDASRWRFRTVPINPLRGALAEAPKQIGGLWLLPFIRAIGCARRSGWNGLNQRYRLRRVQPPEDPFKARGRNKGLEPFSGLDCLTASQLKATPNELGRRGRCCSARVTRPGGCEIRPR